LDQGGRQAQLRGSLADELDGEGNREEAVVGGGEQTGEDDRYPGGEQLQAEGAADEDPDTASRCYPQCPRLRRLGGLELLRVYSRGLYRSPAGGWMLKIRSCGPRAASGTTSKIDGAPSQEPCRKMRVGGKSPGSSISRW
jgi:hypothetical protein